MIKIDFVWSVTILISLIPVLVLWAWIFYTMNGSKASRESSALEQCPFCTYLFFDFSQSRYKNCPRCRSLIGGEDKPENTESSMRRSNLLKNESGVILVTVILLVITLSVVAIGIMSLNISQVSTSKSVVDAVVAEQLATGLFYQNYQQKFDGGTATLSTTIDIETVDGPRTYQISRSDTLGSPSTPNNTNELQINLTYE